MKALLFSGAAICAFFLPLVPTAHAQPGSLDITFNPGSGAEDVLCMALETNGQIVIGGGFRSFNGAYAPYITRLNSDGSIDPTFSTGVGPNQGITCIALRPDGEILIAGGFGSINGVNWNQPALLRVDGSVDLSFNTSYAAGAGSTGGVSALALQPDGKVLIAGGVLSIGGTNYSNLARLNTNGTLERVLKMHCSY
jgi:uncharacterized delta-60 repeat protein